VFYFSIALTVAANIVYHVAQKSIPKGVNPVVSVLVTYLVAIGVTLLLLPVLAGPGEVKTSLRQLNWATYAIGIAIVAIEVGFLLVYRSGWDLSVASVTASAAIAVLLLPIGVFVFRERVSATNFLGILLCLAGLVLVSRR